MNSINWSENLKSKSIKPPAPNNWKWTGEKWNILSKIINIGALISGGGTNLQAVIDACHSKTIDARITFVGTDNPQARGLERARNNQITSFVVDYRSIIKKYRQTP